jgi:hypothetical protein
VHTLGGEKGSNEVEGDGDEDQPINVGDGEASLIAELREGALSSDELTNDGSGKACSSKTDTFFQEVAEGQQTCQ